MIWIALLSWLMISIVSPSTLDFADYATVQQIEHSYVLALLLFIFYKYGNKVGVCVIWSFCFYYLWLAMTDYIISYMPIWLSNLESFVFFTILVVMFNRLTKRHKA